MKNFIVLAAALPLLLIFMMQFGTEMKVADIKNDTMEIVYEHAERARLDGGFLAVKNDLKAALSVRMNVDLDDVYITNYSGTFTAAEMELGEVFMYLDDGPLYKGYSHVPSEFVRYKVFIKIHDVVSGSRFFGIEDATVMYPIEGKIMSERLRP